MILHRPDERFSRLRLLRPPARVELLNPRAAFRGQRVPHGQKVASGQAEDDGAEDHIKARAGGGGLRVKQSGVAHRKGRFQPCRKDDQAGLLPVEDMEGFVFFGKVEPKLRGKIGHDFAYRISRSLSMSRSRRPVT